jgi:hypothetical protein
MLPLGVEAILVLEVEVVVVAPLRPGLRVLLGGFHARPHRVPGDGAIAHLLIVGDLTQVHAEVPALTAVNSLSPR